MKLDACYAHRRQLLQGWTRESFKCCSFKTKQNKTKLMIGIRLFFYFFWISDYITISVWFWFKHEKKFYFDVCLSAHLSQPFLQTTDKLPLSKNRQAERVARAWSMSLLVCLFFASEVIFLPLVPFVFRDAYFLTVWHSKHSQGYKEVAFCNQIYSSPMNNDKDNASLYGVGSRSDGLPLALANPLSLFLTHHLYHHHASLRHGWWARCLLWVAKTWTCNPSFTHSTAETRLEAFK